MLSIGQVFPNFTVQATLSRDPKQPFVEINQSTYADLWKIYFFWPKDFTFVCPTEIKSFADLTAQFAERDTQILGVSIDSEYVHLAWRQHHEDLHDIPFPMLADVKRELITALGIIDPHTGVAQRATLIVDPHNIIRFVMVTDLNVGRNTAEILRVLDALQTDELCPCNWQKGDKTLNSVLESA